MPGTKEANDHPKHKKGWCGMSSPEYIELPDGQFRRINSKGKGGGSTSNRNQLNTTNDGIAKDTKPQPPKTNFVISKNEEPYFQVDMSEGLCRFAHLVNGSVQFQDVVDSYEPQPLPLVNGKPLRLVLMPDANILNTTLCTPDGLFGRIKSHIARYVDLVPLDLELCVYYIIFTWFYQKVNTVAYNRLLGDTGKGKTRAKKVIGDLCFYPIIASGASTFSGIARTKEKFQGTLVIDEADIAGDAAHQLIKYLNLGFERGQNFILSDKKNPRNQDYFDPFCPKVIAMRQPFRDNATEGRLLSISMHETGNKSIPIILPDNYDTETQQLRNELCRFVLEHWKDIDRAKMLDLSNLEIEPRLKQLAMPLSIVFQLWTEGEERFKEYLLKRQQEIRRIRATSWDGTLVNTVIQLALGEIELPIEFQQYHTDNGRPVAVTPSMVAKVTGITSKTATERLVGCSFELELKGVKVGAVEKLKTVRAYSVPNGNSWREILSRYYVNNSDAIPVLPDNLKGRFFTDFTDFTDYGQKNTPQDNSGDGVLFRAKTVKSVKTVNNNNLLDCPVCGRNEWAYTPDGDLLCPCGNVLKETKQ